MVVTIILKKIRIQINRNLSISMPHIVLVVHLKFTHNRHILYLYLLNPATPPGLAIEPLLPVHLSLGGVSARSPGASKWLLYDRMDQ